jgi:hypothetical protein
MQQMQANPFRKYSKIGFASTASLIQLEIVKSFADFFSQYLLFATTPEGPWN